jgi:hypothetical protein
VKIFKKKRLKKQKKKKKKRRKTHWRRPGGRKVTVDQKLNIAALGGGGADRRTAACAPSVVRAKLHRFEFSSRGRLHPSPCLASTGTGWLQLETLQDSLVRPSSLEFFKFIPVEQPDQIQILLFN